MLTEWFEMNKISKEVQRLNYADMPSRFVWDRKNKVWVQRKQRGNIGKVVRVHPAAGEKYYVKILVNVLKGATSFEDLLTVGGVKHTTFKNACYARGLLEENKEWNDVMDEASTWATTRQLRQLFALILIQCELSHPQKLWNHCWKYLLEDVQKLQTSSLTIHQSEVKAEEAKQHTLCEIEKLIQENGMLITDFPSI